MNTGGWRFRGALLAVLTVVPLATVAFTDISATAAPTPNCVLVANPTKSHHTVCPDQNLNHAEWSHEDLRYADFQGSNLTGAHFRLAHLDYANLSHATLTDAQMQQITAKYADFKDAILTNVSMQDSKLDHDDMTDAKFVDSPDPYSGKGPRLDMAGAFMPFSTLNGARLEGGNWSKVDLQDAKLRGVIAAPYFSHTILVHADLTNAVIFTNWQDADLRLAIFCNTYLQGRPIDNSGCP